ncbi:MAG: hypothetical protein J2P16_12135 [Mycobacterium sp.]|nr:hypothetical protein [Mycobacterium sp.]
MQPTHWVHPRQATHATENRVAAQKKTITLPTATTLPAVAIEPATAMLPAVAIEPATPMLPAVAIEPATPMLSAGSAGAGGAAALIRKPLLSVIMGKACHHRRPHPR